MPTTTLSQLHAQVVACTRCPRLRTYCTAVGKEKRRAFADWTYWTRPVPGFGDPAARIWIVGLAPAAHGANRTGRVFTGDNSGNFLYAALHRAGLANQPTATSRDDGLALTDCYISATARCAPPANKPTPEEITQCAGYLDEEWRLLRQKRVLLALGKIAWDATLALAARQGCEIPRPRPAFAHAAETQLTPTLHLLGSYHVSQQNTFTGKLTSAMFDAVLQRAKKIAESAA
ncbi:MAG TPA: uracil-DNA glycosylase [Phycisphaerae bacterium]|nr:uracil-DNA glycosylase [Phycisphaerae bacterium]